MRFFHYDSIINGCIHISCCYVPSAAWYQGVSGNGGLSITRRVSGWYGGCFICRYLHTVCTCKYSSGGYGDCLHLTIVKSKFTCCAGWVLVSFPCGRHGLRLGKGDRM